jgi:ribosome-associated protein
MAADLVVTDSIVIPGTELSWSFSRSGGPGGQNVNKVASKAELRWTPAGSRAFAGLDEATRAWVLSRLAGRLTLDGELIVVSQLTRDQGKNRSDALLKLAGIVSAALFRPKKRRPTRPSRASKDRRIGEKKRRSEIKKGRRGGGD